VNGAVETGRKRTRSFFFAARAEPSRTGFMCLNGAKTGDVERMQLGTGMLNVAFPTY